MHLPLGNPKRRCQANPDLIPVSAKKTPIWATELCVKLSPRTPKFNVGALGCVDDAREMGVFFAGHESPPDTIPNIELGGGGG